MRIRLDRIVRLIKVYDETSYLALFGSEKYDSIYNRIRYLISVKSDITYIISHNYTKIKVGSYTSLRLEKTMTVHNVILLIYVIKIKTTTAIIYSYRNLLMN